MNPNDATNEELRDWLAIKQGWNKASWGLWHHNESFLLPAGQHPIPNTIDAAAKCLPDGWIDYAAGIARAAVRTIGKAGCVTVARTADEATDRFRLAVKAIMAMEEARCQ